VKIKESKMNLSQRVLGAVDLAIEFATLGEYGLEEIDTATPVVAGGQCRRERSGRRAGWEALATARRRRCDAPRLTANCLSDAYTARR
jgi:hypothetical protein